MKKNNQYAYLESGLQDSHFRQKWLELDSDEQMKQLLKYIRFKNDLTQKDLSSLSGISQVIICKLENNKARHNISTLEKLAAAVGMKLNIEFTECKKKNRRLLCPALFLTERK